MHHNIGGLQCAIRDKLVTGIALDSHVQPDAICEPCLAGKLHTVPFPSTGTVTAGVLDLVHADLLEMPVCSVSGFHYVFSFHHATSGFHAVYPLHTKDSPFDTFLDLHMFPELQTGHHMKSFQDDKGGKFVGRHWDVL